MNQPQSPFHRPLVAAILGGAIVAVVGLVAIATGLVNSGGHTTTTVAASQSAPIASTSGEDGDGNTVNEIYKADGDGVAFVESQIGSEEVESSPFSPFGEPESEGGGTATGSGFVIDTEGHIITNNHV